VPLTSSALTQTDGAAEVSPSLMPAGINRAGRGGNASVMVAAESFERVSALGECNIAAISPSPYSAARPRTVDLDFTCFNPMAAGTGLGK